MEATSSEGAGKGTDRWQALAWLAILCSAGAVFFGNLRFGKDVLAVGFEDDFFYYAQVARNLASTGRSTFDGIHLTNGYHPLWLLVLTAVTKVSGQGGLFHATTVFPLAVTTEALQCALVIAIASLTQRICQPFCSTPVCAGILLLQASFAIVLVRTGMEVGLTLAAGLGLLCFRVHPAFRWSNRQAVCVGLLASVCVLSRLDSIVLVGLLFLFDLVPAVRRGTAKTRSLFLVLLGLGPVVIYVLLNRVIFGVLTPVSGMAKQMRAHHVPSLIGLQSFLGAMTVAGSPLLGPCVLLILVAMVFLASGRSKLPDGLRGPYWAVLLFPPVHLLTIITLSDWKLWPWYNYPWLLSGTLAAMIVWGSGEEDRRPSPTRYQVPSFVLCLLFLLAYAAAVARRSNPRNNLTYAAGLEIQAFAKGHPGVYAMGDRSGAVGYLIDQPLVQLEGLTMDKAFLANIREQRGLEDVLREYGVRYYISTRAVRDAEGCYAVKEPWQAGPDSPAMRGRICKAPAATFQHGAFLNHLFVMDGPPLP